LSHDFLIKKYFKNFVYAQNIKNKPCFSMPDSMPMVSTIFPTKEDLESKPMVSAIFLARKDLESKPMVSAIFLARKDLESKLVP
jgi:hypothetical protein